MSSEVLTALKIDPKKLKHMVLLVDKLVPNDWNPNKMNERTYEAERESIREHGFIDPILVREHPSKRGFFEIIDGEHRWRAAQDEGYAEVLADSLGKLSDIDAKRLTITFNETRGESDVALLGKLMVSINAEADGQEWWTGLPFSEAERTHYLELGAVDWDNFTPPQTGGDGEGNGTPANTVALSFDQEAHEKWTTFMGMLGREWELDSAEAIALRAVQEAAERL